MADESEQPAQLNAQQSAAGGSKVTETKTASEERFERFTRRGEEIIETFIQSINSFDAYASEIKVLKNRMDKIDSGHETNSSSEPSAKRSHSEPDPEQDEGDLDALMSGPVKRQKIAETSDDMILEDLDSFFETEKETGDEVLDQVATVVEKSLRRSKTDPEKIKQLQEKYLRPANIEALQVPRVDMFLWNQLKSNIKTQDVGRQHVIGGLNKTAAPLIQAMNHCCETDTPDVDFLKTCITDAFKIICGQINQVNQERRETIKKELDSKFKRVCDETTVTATGLFGDNLPELSKQLEQEKTIKMTHRESFLGHGRGNKSNNQDLVLQEQLQEQLQEPAQLRVLQPKQGQGPCSKLQELEKIRKQVVEKQKRELNSNRTSATEGLARSGRGGVGGASVDDSALVATTSETSEPGQLSSTITATVPEPPSQTRSEASFNKDGIGSFPLVREALCQQGFLDKSAKIILSGWRQSTHRQYVSFIKRWLQFCNRRQADPAEPPVSLVVAFLEELFQTGLGYSALGTARAAINAFTNICKGVNMSHNNILNKFMKGVFHNRPNLPKRQVRWDVQVVLDFLSSTENQSLLFLSGKLCTLFLLLSAQRCQTLHLAQVDDIVISKTQVTLLTNHLLKQSRPGFHPEPITLNHYPVNRKLCIVTVFEDYFTRTSGLRSSADTSLLINTQKPHRGVTRATVGRWIKTILSKSGVDSCFTPHSTRAVATSTAKRRGVSMGEIARAAGWSNVTTFQRFYDKPVQQTVQSAILP